MNREFKRGVHAALWSVFVWFVIGAVGAGLAANPGDMQVWHAYVVGLIAGLVTMAFMLAMWSGR